MRPNSQVDCALAQDLLIPYVSGDIQPATRDWMNLQLSSCPTCQAELQEALQANGAVVTAAPPNEPSADDRPLINRVRRSVLILVGAVTLVGALGIGGIIWTVLSFRTWTNMPAYAAPPAETAPIAIALSDLRWLGLSAAVEEESSQRAVVLYTDAGGNRIRVSASRYESDEEALSSYKRWLRGYSTRMFSAEMDSPRENTVKFRSGGEFLYGWRGGNWVIVLEVLGNAERPAELRDQVRDQIFQAVPRR